MRYIIKLLCLSLSLILLLPFVGFSAERDKPKVAFFYGVVPDELLYLYDWVIFNPETFTKTLLKERFYLKKRAKLIAYFSVGETSSEDSLPDNCYLGKNKTWDTEIVDLRKKTCYSLLLQKAEKLLSSYDGVFLDTLTSYQKVLPKKAWKSYENVEVSFIKDLRKK